MADIRETIIDPDNGPGTDYTSADTWEDDFGGVANSGDCVGEDEIARGTCRCTGGTADTTPISIAGWTNTDSTRYIDLWTDPDETYRHENVFPLSGNIYRFSVSAISWIQEAYVHIHGLAIELNTPLGNGVHLFNINVANVYFYENILRGVNLGATENHIALYFNTTAGSSFVYNNILYGFSTTGTIGIRIVVQTVYGYYNTFVDNRTGVTRNSGTVVLKNNIAFGNTTDYYGTFSSASTHNGYTAGQSGPDGALNSINLGADGTAIFADYTGDDFTIDSENSPAAAVGTDLRSDSNLPVSLDIARIARHASTPEIGAYEIPPPPSTIKATQKEQFQYGVSRWTLNALLDPEAYYP